MDTFNVVMATLAAVTVVSSVLAIIIVLVAF